ncbi:hypothetical protein [Polaribacter cellanae]|uniref:Uncharacterized protein n=1 Tax=Polaribacter cellanae TaxID=2818493 RepID=A0A975H6E2_9FLAO|nr:hypothetical protein [Polaribacter cellanae]QTE21824.1 hypothetical protein J3359_13505 [Polaribacter cellanae]
MRIYICNIDKCISFDKNSNEYEFLINIFLNNKISKNKAILKISERIESILKSRELDTKSHNLIEKTFNNKKLSLGRDSTDIRLIFLINLLNIVNKKDYSTYIIEKIKPNIKNEFNYLKQGTKNINDLDIEIIKCLFNLSLLKSKNNIIELSEKGERISLLL